MFWFFHSAGVGKTACFIAIDSMLQRIENDYTVDIYGYVTMMRSQRNFMIQSDVSSDCTTISCKIYNSMGIGTTFWFSCSCKGCAIGNLHFNKCPGFNSYRPFIYS